MVQSYFDTLTCLARLEQDVKKSRFVGVAARVDSIDVAMAFFAEHHVGDASHNCWAYKVGSAYRFNDDGEPGGTAGKPILQAIEGQGLDHVAVLVIRWFGGVKLGAGGLVRAYGGCAAECLRLADKTRVVATSAVHFVCAYSEQGAVRQKLAAVGAVLIEQTFDAEHVVFSAHVPSGACGTLALALADITRGKSAWRVASDDGEG